MADEPSLCLSRWGKYEAASESVPLMGEWSGWNELPVDSQPGPMESQALLPH
jgi:hypothetical protein